MLEGALVDLRDYVRTFREHRLLIAVIVLSCIALAALFTMRSTPQYASTSRLFVSTSASDDGQAFQGGQFSLQRVKSYADLLNGEEISRRTVEALKLDESPRELASQITASAKLDTVILSITVTDPSPERAQLLAKTVSEEFVAYVAELETPPGQDEATVKATVVDGATEPNAPISPQPVRNLGLAAVLGLLLGAGVAVLRDTLDTTIKSPQQLEELVDAPLIGSITFDSAASNEPLITALDPYAPRVEAFRVLRTNLQFIDPDQSKKVFVVTSSLPGEGKSTTAANLAIALAEGGERVVLVEGDMRRPKVTEYLNMEGSVGLTTVLVGRVGLEYAVQPSPVAGLDVLTSGKIPPNPAELIKSNAMADTVKTLREQYDYVLIDATPLLPVTDAALMSSLADGALLVVRHGKTTVDQVRLAVDRLGAVDARPVGVILNMTPKNGRGRGGYGYSYGYSYGYAPSPTSHADETSSSFWRGRRSGSEHKPTAEQDQQASHEAGDQEAPSSRLT